MTAYLVLENGMIFEGKSFGASFDIIGEVVFATAMTGYLETLTDPSYYGQIIVQTFPLIGNYGVISEDFEYKNIAPKAYIVRYPCQDPSNFRSEGDLDTFLRKQNIVGLHGIDTRQLTKVIRENGVMNGIITTKNPAEVDLKPVKEYTIINALSAVSKNEKIIDGNGKRTVALMDFGAKKSIVDNLVSRDCTVHTFPYNATAEDILSINPMGVMLSNGPGDPSAKENDSIIETLQKLMSLGIPIFGICLGHQLLALANGYKTEKLKFGHRGSNQPVKDLSTGRVYITSQNHGYAVVNGGNSFINVNDKTCEGIDYGLSFSVQFHPEAHGGPLDTSFLFDRFMERVDKYAIR
ncbi:MAG: carbamoyl phosphate synthase small subunit [Defluviitaleaceae bacterium]|nr:carbamoyl phosphate synthase small subunit [Defluviitaleaceae bacterium]